MKNLKTILLILPFVFLSCSSDDDNGGDTTPMTQEVTATLDLTALANLTGTDATALISFNGVPAAQHTTEAIPGDEIRYKVTTSSPTTELIFIEYHFSSGSENLWNSLRDNVLLDTAGEYLEGFQIPTDLTFTDGEEFKFDMDFQLVVNGQAQSTVYTIDPKIKLKARR